MGKVGFSTKVKLTVSKVGFSTKVRLTVGKVGFSTKVKLTVGKVGFSTKVKLTVGKVGFSTTNCRQSSLPHVLEMETMKQLTVLSILVLATYTVSRNSILNP